MTRLRIQRLTLWCPCIIPLRQPHIYTHYITKMVPLTLRNIILHLITVLSSVHTSATEIEYTMLDLRTSMST